jgi:hypothetical protein
MQAPAGRQPTVNEGCFPFPVPARCRGDWKRNWEARCDGLAFSPPDGG